MSLSIFHSSVYSSGQTAIVRPRAAMAAMATMAAMETTLQRRRKAGGGATPAPEARERQTMDESRGRLLRAVLNNSINPMGPIGCGKLVS